MDEACGILLFEQFVGLFNFPNYVLLSAINSQLVLIRLPHTIITNLSKCPDTLYKRQNMLQNKRKMTFINACGNQRVNKQVKKQILISCKCSNLLAHELPSCEIHAFYIETAKFIRFNCHKSTKVCRHLEAAVHITE